VIEKVDSTTQETLTVSNFYRPMG